MREAFYLRCDKSLSCLRRLRLGRLLRAKRLGHVMSHLWRYWIARQRIKPDIEVALSPRHLAVLGSKHRQGRGLLREGGR